MSAQACIGPSNIEGVAFTNGETLNLEALAALGEEGSQYLLDNENNQQGMRYVSSYNPDAVVYVGTYGMSYLAGKALQCMGIIVPPAEGADSYARIAREQFNFAEAVCHELRWLKRMGVVTIDSQTLAVIDSTLKAVNNGGLQYWTHARAVLGYNSWYEFDPLVGSWRVEGTNGVKGVRGADVSAVAGCSVIHPGSGKPLLPLSTPPVQASRAMVRPQFGVVAAGGRVRVTLAQPAQAAGEVRLFNAAGVLLGRTAVGVGAQSISCHLPGAAVGMVFVSVSQGGANQTRTFLAP
jgi:hypothetical protein